MTKLGQLCWSALGLFPSHLSTELSPACGPSLLQHCQSRPVEALGSGTCFCRGKAGAWPLPLTSKLTNGQMTVREWACHLAACFRFQAHAKCESRFIESPVVAYLATQRMSCCHACLFQGHEGSCRVAGWGRDPVERAGQRSPACLAASAACWQGLHPPPCEIAVKGFCRGLQKM